MVYFLNLKLERERELSQVTGVFILAATTLGENEEEDDNMLEEIVLDVEGLAPSAVTFSKVTSVLREGLKGGDFFSSFATKFLWRLWGRCIFFFFPVQHALIFFTTLTSFCAG